MMPTRRMIPGHVCLAAALACLPLCSATADTFPQNTYEVGQLWECTVRHQMAPTTERLQFIVTGQAIRRDLSPRKNFQTDDIIISVALFDRDPKACKRVRSLYHVGFDQSALDNCGPKLQSDVAADSLVSEEFKEKMGLARLRWLHLMQAKKGVTVGLTPSHFAVVLRRKRCGQ